MKWTKSTQSMTELLAPFMWSNDETAHKTFSSKNYYEWYYTYALILRPERVAEIGIQRGYSVISMLMGYPSIKNFYLFDNESYGFSLGTAVKQIRRAQLACGSVTELHAFLLDTRKIGSLPIRSIIDLGHVDGDHTYGGALHDLALITPLIRPGGAIILDDLNQPNVARAAADFLTIHPEFEVEEVPTYTGHLILTRII